MRAALAGDVGEADVGGWTAPVARDAAQRASAAPTPPAPAPFEPPSRYGESRRISLPALAAIAAIHALLLWALIAFDVIAVSAKPKEPLVVTLIPEPIEPPPVPAVEPKPEVEPVEPQVFAPPPVVTVAQPAPPPIAVSRTPAPPEPAPAVAVAPASEGAPVAAPVSPPVPLGGKAGNPPPQYPVEARRRKWQGVVRLRVLVSVSGEVKEVRVASSSGHDLLDEAAAKAVGRWKFQPALQAGSAVEGVGYLNIPFVLKA